MNPDMPTHTVHHYSTACTCYVPASIAVAGCIYTSTASEPVTAYWQALIYCVADSKSQLVYACCSLLFVLFVYTDCQQLPTQAIVGIIGISVPFVAQSGGITD